MRVLSSHRESVYRFGEFCLDPVKRVLTRGGESVPLTPKRFDILLLLVRHRDRVLDKDELMKEVWQETFVEETNLTHNISVLRKALGEKAGEHRFIVTVPGHGYRFVAYVNDIGGVSNIWLQPLAAGAGARQITHFQSERITAFDWSPDGKYLALARVNESS